MPRIHNPTALRSRNRVTNKTRLKIHHGDIDFDPDDSPIPISNDTAGVDAEDANEHHLQAVLSAASQQNLGNPKKSARGSAAEKASAPVQAYIPTPNATGVVEGHEELYPLGKWTDPATYIRSSETVDEAIDCGLTGTWTYFMDERDMDWLEKNNEEARGEGTSASGAMSASGTSTRSGSSRSSKAKGKEPEVVQPLVMSENEFELVMGLYEKVTHEKTEYLHHGLEQGMAFPPFSDYQETFSATLASATFATFTLPSWIPAPSHLVRIARVIYPYWRDKRIERGGHRIIPTLNFDETDTQNESYICFRRREIKAVRKTRASQATSSDKLLRLQSELLSSLELAKTVLTRETLKRETAKHTQHVWENRLKLVDFKRKYPMLGAREDDELLHDKERVPKRPRVDSTSAKLPGLRIRTHGGDMSSPSAHMEAAIRPRDRAGAIQSQIERELARLKDRDHHWEDVVDNPYQPQPVPYSHRLFKYIPPHKSRSSSLTSTDDEDEDVAPRAIRIRRGRGGRWFIDKGLPVRRNLSAEDISSTFSFRRPMRENSPDSEATERAWRLADRWKFDQDDDPAYGPDGPEEHDRVLLDDYDPKYLRHAITLLAEPDQQILTTDNSLNVTGPEGRMQTIVPYRLGMQPPMIRRDAQLAQAQRAAMGGHSSQLVSLSSVSTPNGMPISVQTQIKKMPPPIGAPQVQPRISSNGVMRPPATPVIANLSSNPTHAQPSPPQIPGPAASQPTNGSNGVHYSPNHVSQSIPHKAESLSPAMANGQPSGLAEINNTALNAIPVSRPQNDFTSPIRPKSSSSQNQHIPVPMQNGYHVGSMNGFPTMPNGMPYMQPNGQQNGLSVQQLQNLKSVFGTNQDMTNAHLVNGMSNGTRIPAPYLMNGTHFDMQNLKLPPARQQQQQWSAVPSPLQRSAALNNSIDLNASISPSPNMGHTQLGQGLPMRTSSANGQRNGTRVPSHMMTGQAGTLQAMSMSPYMQHSPSPMPMNGSLQHTPPRPSPTPPVNMVSPSLQHQQMVGGAQNGY